MIRYAIACEHGHVFDVWFASADSAADQIASGDVACPHCGATQVRKALMAPRIAAGATRAEPPAPAEPPAADAAVRSAPPAAGPPPRAVLERLWALREAVERNAENVGGDFAEEARRMHEGDADARPIWGECAPEDALELWEDGAPVAPLPPKRPEDA